MRMRATSVIRQGHDTSLSASFPLSLCTWLALNLQLVTTL